MMKSVEALRQRVSSSVGGTLGYAPVQLSDSDEDDYEYGGFGERRTRVRTGRAGEGALGVKEAETTESDEDKLLWPHYTPLYTNMKVLNRKRLDASMVYYRAGPCTKACFVMSVWGVAFLTWLGFTLAGGSPYIIPEGDAETLSALSHSVFGAAAMYFVCSCIAGFSWYKSSYGARPLPTMGDASLQ